VAQTVDWLPSPEGSLAFRRLAADGSSVVCVVACSDAAVPLPAYDEVLVASTDLEQGADGETRLPGNSAVWLQVR
jgi:alpha-glucosidase